DRHPVDELAAQPLGRADSRRGDQRRQPSGTGGPGAWRGPRLPEQAGQAGCAAGADQPAPAPALTAPAGRIYPDPTRDVGRVQPATLASAAPCPAGFTRPTAAPGRLQAPLGQCKNRRPAGFIPARRETWGGCNPPRSQAPYPVRRVSPALRQLPAACRRPFGQCQPPAGRGYPGPAPDVGRVATRRAPTPLAG